MFEIMNRIRRNITFRRVPLYFVLAAALFYVVPTVGFLGTLSVGLKAIFALAFAPVMIEVARMVLFHPPARRPNVRGPFASVEQYDWLRNYPNLPVFNSTNAYETQDRHVDENVDKELERLATSREGATERLNACQEQALIDMEDRYRGRYRQKSEPVIFEEISAYLIDAYEKNPAVYLNRPLPLGGAAQEQNVAYYQHPVHAAYRYLFLAPNPWARYGGRSSITTEDKTKIAYMWLAATDPNQKLPEGQTRESLLSEFVQAIYELCRAHNYDRVRPVQRTRINKRSKLQESYIAQEHFDDLEGDKPTCGGGVRQRAVQFYMVFLNDRPETRPLTPDVMRTKFTEQMVNDSSTAGTIFKKLQTMDNGRLSHLKDAIESKYIVQDPISDKEQRLLESLAFLPDEIDVFIEECKTYYGPGRISEQTALTVRNETFQTYENLIRFYAKNASGEFCNHILRNVEQLMEAKKVQRTSNRLMQTFT